MRLPSQVKIVEVGPRDGLQNEPMNVPTEIKVNFINQLSKTGLQTIEVTSFVSPHWIPQMADHNEVLNQIERNPEVNYSALVPNEHGMQDALKTPLQEIGIFTAASETFCHKNINCSIEESLQRFQSVIALAKQHHLRIRAYISCVLGCPYEGEINPLHVVKLAMHLIDLGCDEISLGDTIGVGTPENAKQLIQLCSDTIPLDKIAVHFHDTYGQALANIYAALQQGIHIIDSSVAGLGGCPYAKGASGNVATEDVLYLLQGLGIKTGVNLEKVVSVGNYICQQIHKENRSKVARVLQSKQQ